MSLQNAISSKQVAPHDMVFEVNGVSFTMVNVKGGSFWMGAQNKDPKERYYDKAAWDNESPIHHVTLDSFHLGETVVTQALWKAVTGKEMYNGFWKEELGKGDDYPAYGVDWYEMNQFLKKLNELTEQNFRLPTEAEWEYAARGGNRSQGYRFAGSNKLELVAWFEDNSHKKTHSVKTKKANELGLYDMSGNLWEWCSDYYGQYSPEPQVNPTGAPERWLWVLRGGSWFNEADACRVANRFRYIEGVDHSLLGFRLALSNS